MNICYRLAKLHLMQLGNALIIQVIDQLWKIHKKYTSVFVVLKLSLRYMLKVKPIKSMVNVHMFNQNLDLSTVTVFVVHFFTIEHKINKKISSYVIWFLSWHRPIQVPLPSQNEKTKQTKNKKISKQWNICKGLNVI